MREALVFGRTLPEAYHKALVELSENGEHSDCADWNTTQKELSLTFQVAEPLGEPMISKLFIVCGALTDVVREEHAVNAVTYSVYIVLRYDIRNTRFRFDRFFLECIQSLSPFFSRQHSLVAVDTAVTMSGHGFGFISLCLVEDRLDHLRSLLFKRQRADDLLGSHGSVPLVFVLIFTLWKLLCSTR